MIIYKNILKVSILIPVTSLYIFIAQVEWKNWAYVRQGSLPDQMWHFVKGRTKNKLKDST